MIDLYAVLTHLCPGLQIGVDCDVELYDDGDGPYIARWRDPRDAPAAAEIAAAWPEVQRGQVIAAIDAHAASLRDAAVEGVNPAEMASWAIKRAEALAYDGTAMSCPMLAAEAAARGCDVAVIVGRVHANAGALSALEAQIAGVAGRHKDAVRSAAEPAAYDWSVGWPT